MELPNSISEMQERLLMMNRTGAVMQIFDDEGKVSIEATLDTFVVVRIEGDAWWLSWKPIWHAEIHDIHVVKIVKTEIVDQVTTKHDGQQWVMLNITDSYGRKMAVEAILPVLHPNEHKNWKNWRDHRNKNKEKYNDLDQQAFKIHKRLAEEWNED